MYWNFGEVQSRMSSSGGMPSLTDWISTDGDTSSKLLASNLQRAKCSFRQKKHFKSISYQGSNSCNNSWAPSWGSIDQILLVHKNASRKWALPSWYFNHECSIMPTHSFLLKSPIFKKTHVCRNDENSRILGKIFLVISDAEFLLLVFWPFESDNCNYNYHEVKWKECRCKLNHFIH